MKLLYSWAVGLLGLTACSKENNVTPHLQAAFNQEVTLRYSQTASLPDLQAPELTLTLEDVLDQRCPPCFSPGTVQAVLAVQSQNGERQAVRLCLGCGSATGLSDSAAVQANNQRYVLTLHQVTPVDTGSGGNGPKKDKQAVLTVQR
ncbi:hypothetical protein GCM10011375_40960 [Hymenobacter qilianensis]|uniref:Uncharacterized protein n=2 Tax=Hymenobacter qilianensis TaxID=1385715 RepID=A0ACB5PXF8_9BACT|nr:hypothetical protein [Hymenobacter qilianensis]QNP54549.1 hypothetical protein H9L05_22640 [Hymenobacter qilianensis]GGF81820.1 hypothetical protein GCM10011375_40960 [Hymenobacter qilianensis]